MDTSRLEQQIEFLREIDHLKQVQRKSFISGARRLENSAEHSWHVAMMALVLSEHARPPGVNVGRVIQMLLIHDIVEVDAGDTLLYAEADAMKLQRERELVAAERLFGLLPEPEGQALRSLWDEFEARESADAKFAAAMDRLQPLLLNFMAEGAAWRRYAVTAVDVRAKNRHIADASPELWEFAERLIDEAVRRGYLRHEL